MEQFYDVHLYRQKSLEYEIEIFRDDQISKKKQSFISSSQMSYNEKTNMSAECLLKNLLYGITSLQAFVHKC